MVLLVSDFDGTLNPELFGNIYSNLTAVDDFRMSGNLFMLSTGRNYNSIYKQINRYKIRYDYLACNDGGILYDKHDTKLFASYIEEEKLLKLTSYLNNLDGIKKYYYYGDKGIIDNGNTIELGVDADFSKVNYIKQSVESIFPMFSVIAIGDKMFIETKGGKTRAINHVLTLKDIDKVYTIGDSINDIDMLTDFNGYKIFLGSSKLLNKNIKTAFTVKSLVKKINML